MDPLLPFLHPNPGWNSTDLQKLPKPISSIPSGMIGKHCILELYDCNKNKLNDESFVRTTITLSAKISGANLINLITHSFNPQGITALALLAESHISIHTWPEIGYGAVDVFTCGEQTMPERACDVFIKEFSAKKFSLKTLQRDTPNFLSKSEQ